MEGLNPSTGNEDYEEPVDDGETEEDGTDQGGSKVESITGVNGGGGAAACILAF